MEFVSVHLELDLTSNFNILYEYCFVNVLELRNQWWSEGESNPIDQTGEIWFRNRHGLAPSTVITVAKTELRIDKLIIKFSTGLFWLYLN